MIIFHFCNGCGNESRIFRNYREYSELETNQQLLRAIVRRKGVPILDEVLSGLHQTRAILNGCVENFNSYNQSILNNDQESLDFRDVYLDGSCSFYASCRNEVIAMLEQM